MELLNTIFFLHFSYLLGVKYFGNPAFLTVLPWTLFGSIILGAITESIVQVSFSSRYLPLLNDHQSWFAHRIKILSKRWEISVVCWLLAILRLATVIYLTTITTGKTAEVDVQKLGQLFAKLLNLTLASATGLDGLVASVLAVYLWRV